jgi:hypothetical protein
MRIGYGESLCRTGWILCLRARVDFILSGGLMLMGGGAGSLRRRWFGELSAEGISGGGGGSELSQGGGGAES